MGDIEAVEAEKMGWLDLPRGTSYPTFPYGFDNTSSITISCASSISGDTVGQRIELIT